MVPTVLAPMRRLKVVAVADEVLPMPVLQRGGLSFIQRQVQQQQLQQQLTPSSINNKMALLPHEKPTYAITLRDTCAIGRAPDANYTVANWDTPYMWNTGLWKKRKRPSVPSPTAVAIQTVGKTTTMTTTMKMAMATKIIPVSEKFRSREIWTAFRKTNAEK